MNIGASWTKETQSGEKYLSCIMSVPFLGKINFAIFKNKEKTKDGQPDYHIVWNDAEKKKSNNKSDVINFDDLASF